MSWKLVTKAGANYRIEDENGNTIGSFRGHSLDVSVSLNYGGKAFAYPPREDSPCTIDEAVGFVRGVEAALTIP